MVGVSNDVVNTRGGWTHVMVRHVYMTKISIPIIN